VDVELERRLVAVSGARPEEEVILLDTNAVIWIDQNHARARALVKATGPLRLSPATVLELQFLNEIGRLRLRSGLRDVVDDERWEVDEPPALEWFMRSAEEAWTRDPFDRLIVAHARVRRCRLATGDRRVLEQLRPSERFAL
jgi:PIN domain nuclease of toxin-antitoxin system